MRVEFLGTAGSMPTPRPLCRCAICVQARELGVPYARSGPSLFVHGPNVLIDTPGEIAFQLNRSTVTEIAACFYSHWHPDHTMGRHIFSLLNVNFPAWPHVPLGTTPLYLPEQVAADTREFLGIWEHLQFLQDGEQVVQIHELRDGDTVEINGVSVRPLRLAQDFVYGFLFDDGGRRLLVVMDEMHEWEPPPEAQGVDLAVVPKGIAEFDAFTGERHVPADHPALLEEATLEQTLEIVRKLNAQRVLMTHIEDSDGLGYDDLVRLEERLRADGSNITFAYDTQIVDV